MQFKVLFPVTARLNTNDAWLYQRCQVRPFRTNWCKERKTFPLYFGCSCVFIWNESSLLLDSCLLYVNAIFMQSSFSYLLESGNFRVHIYLCVFVRILMYMFAVGPWIFYAVILVTYFWISRGLQLTAIDLQQNC